MNYKLAKQLKESGFPQKRLGVHITKDNEKFRCSDYVDCVCPICFGEETADLVAEPTLEEVIEELGDNFRKLIRGAENYWEALSNNEIDIGKTPLEAVSNLYIKLTRNNKA